MKKISSFHSLLCFAVTSALLIPYALADEGEYSNLELEDLLNSRIDSTVKVSHGDYESPATVIGIDSEEIRRFGYRTLKEALQYVIGFYTFSDRNYDYLGVRGFGKPSSFNTRILLMVDGHKVNEPLFDYAPIGEDLHIDIDSVERIDVLKGPVSAVWGTNALLGVINIITKDGRNHQGVRTKIDYGSHHRTKGLLEFGSFEKDGLEFFGSISGLNSNGEKSIFYPEFNTPDTNFGRATGVDGEWAGRGYLKASYNDFTFYVNHGRRKKTDAAFNAGTRFNDPHNYTVDQATEVDLRFERKIDLKREGWASARIYYDRVKYYNPSSLTVEYDESFLSPISDNYVQGREDVGSKVLGIEGNYSFELFPSLSLLSGVELYRAFDITWIAGQSYPSENIFSDTKASYTVASALTELNYAFGYGISFIGTARFDHYTTVGGEWSPRLGIVYAPTTSTKIKFLHNRAYRAPSASQFFVLSPENPSEAIRMTQLKSERVYGEEFTIEHLLSPETRVMGSLFHYRLKDLISNQIEEGQFTSANMGGEETQGAELYFISRLSSALTAHAGLGLSNTKVDNEKNSVNSPQVTSTIGVSVPLINRQLYLSPEFQYVSERKTLINNNLDPVRMVSLTLYSDSVVPNGTVSLSIYDLFNDKPSGPGSEFHRQEKIPADGRTFRISISKKF